jgi:hypothetical protein
LKRTKGEKEKRWNAMDIAEYIQLSGDCEMCVRQGEVYRVENLRPQKYAKEEEERKKSFNISKKKKKEVEDGPQSNPQMSYLPLIHLTLTI